MRSDLVLPTEFPIFPLSGAVLYPHTRLPLTIFEPRYMRMIDAVLGGPRYLGMVQPRTSGAETVGDDGAIYQVGCLGRLTAFGETDDGRYVITLSGIRRFRITRELALQDGYRRVRADFADFDAEPAGNSGEAFDRPGFIATLSAYLKNLGAADSLQAFEDADDQALITAVSMSAPFTPEEKQAILECAGLAEQAQLIASIMQISTYGGDADGPGLKH